MKAEDYFNLIKTGRVNAIKVPSRINREFRALVTEANMNGDTIINVGGGYYRPDPNNLVEREEFRHYIASEYSRARAIANKANTMKHAFINRSQQGQMSFL